MDWFLRNLDLWFFTGLGMVLPGYRTDIDGSVIIYECGTLRDFERPQKGAFFTLFLPWLSYSMKAPGLQNDMGEKTEVGYIIYSYKTDRKDEFFILQQQDLAFRLI